MLLRGAFTVELFYDLMTNGAADSLALLKLFIRHEPNLETRSINILCSLANIMFLTGSLAVELFYDLRTSGAAVIPFFFVVWAGCGLAGADWWLLRK